MDFLILKFISSEKWRSGLNLQSGQRGTAGIKELFEGLKSVISHQGVFKETNLKSNLFGEHSYMTSDFWVGR